MSSTDTQEATDVINEQLGLERWAVHNTVVLLEQDNTIPFIARYRKERTNNLPVDTLREIKQGLDEFKVLKVRVENVIKTVEKAGKLTKELKQAFKQARNVSEVEHLYAPYKSGSKRSLAERARELGLEPLALRIIEKPQGVNLSSAVKPGTEGLSSVEEVGKGVVHILADIVSKDKETMDEVRKLCRTSYVTLESTKSRTAAKKDKEANGSRLPSDKFELYFKFSTSVKNVKPHQVLALNRGENLKILTVKVNIPDKVKDRFIHFCHRKWVRRDANGSCQKLLQAGFDDAYKRLVEPLMVRHIRSELSKTAEKASVEVFGSNLKRLLLTPPVRGKIVMGLDPGFKNGCKFATVSPKGDILDTGVVYLHVGNHRSSEMDKLKRAVVAHRCDTIAIGNGTACRETETLLSSMIKSSAFKPLKVMFCIVSESGASIYSASDAAQKELPDLDVSIRGAVSIAKRLQDPLSELVKIEPKHIGVGMYQHDISEKQLQGSLDGVVEECVSFVGVDVNVAGETLLRRVAGLNSTRAKKIMEWRQTHGAIKNRQQLLAIKGLGPKSYEQCAGFIRVMPATLHRPEEVPDEADGSPVGKKRKLGSSSAAGKAKKAKLDTPSTLNPLDMTCIHPESYGIAERLLSKIGADKGNIGEKSLIDSVKSYVASHGIGGVASELGVGEPTLQLIVDGLTQPVGHDIREEFEKPLFKQGVSSLQDLKIGEKLTGRVANTTHFGAFVDVGVGRDGLIHSSQMPPALLGGKKGLELGDKVEVTVQNVDQQKGRLSLRLIRLC